VYFGFYNHLFLVLLLVLLACLLIFFFIFLSLSFILSFLGGTDRRRACGVRWRCERAARRPGAGACAQAPRRPGRRIPLAFPPWPCQLLEQPRRRKEMRSEARRIGSWRCPSRPDTHRASLLSAMHIRPPHARDDRHKASKKEQQGAEDRANQKKKVKHSHTNKTGSPHRSSICHASFSFASFFSSSASSSPLSSPSAPQPLVTTASHSASNAPVSRPGTWRVATHTH
jgi:hypothetical protein